jgi:hypothetical protein
MILNVNKENQIHPQRAENGKKGISRPKIRTWTTMPLKVGIIATFRGLLTSCSLCKNHRKCKLGI